MSASHPPENAEAAELDPVFRHSRREALIIFCVWLITLLWAVPFCYTNGYPDGFDPKRFTTVWGIPSWLFWGIAVPWLAADVFTTWFCFFFMADDDLGEAHEGADIEDEIAELHAAEASATEDDAEAKS